MSISIGAIRESAPGERRVALVPSLIPLLTKAGYSVLVESGSGAGAGYADGAYAGKGASLVGRAEALAADIVLCARRPAELDAPLVGAAPFRRGAALIGMLDPYAPAPFWSAAAAAGLSVFSMELMPRTTRAQSMDALSSQANLAGYKAALLAAAAFPGAFPMMMTAAGTVSPARVFVLGAGVAGLQAIATARRLGAVVYAYDVRDAAREQVESLGAKFVALDLGAAEGSGGYAKAMDEAYYERQRALLAEAMRDKDIVIATAAIPGRRSPLLVTRAAVEGMAPGSVIVDLAAERGGNCELSDPGRERVVGGVTILAPLDLASSLAFDASALYARNLVNFVIAMTAPSGGLSLDGSDDIVAATLVLKDGAPANESAAASLGL